MMMAKHADMAVNSSNKPIAESLMTKLDVQVLARIETVYDSLQNKIHQTMLL